MMVWCDVIGTVIEMMVWFSEVRWRFWDGKMDQKVEH